MFSPLRALPLLVALLSTGCATAGPADDIAGLYSTRHKVTVEGRKVEIEGYLFIDGSGKMTVYGFQDRGGSLDGKECYFLAYGNAVDSALQGLTLTPGISPMGGEPDYQATAGDDTFGILAAPDKATGTLRWVYHGGKLNNTVTVTGAENIVNSGPRSFSITGPRLTAPTLAEITAKQCAPGPAQ